MCSLTFVNQLKAKTYLVCQSSLNFIRFTPSHKPPRLFPRILSTSLPCLSSAPLPRRCLVRRRIWLRWFSFGVAQFLQFRLQRQPVLPVLRAFGGFLGQQCLLQLLRFAGHGMSQQRTRRDQTPADWGVTSGEFQKDFRRAEFLQPETDLGGVGFGAVLKIMRLDRKSTRL